MNPQRTESHDTLPAPDTLPARLRDLGQGRIEWRVQDKDGAYCIAFSRGDGWSINPEREARAWLADHQHRFPTSSKAGYVVAEVRAQSQEDAAMCEAAEEIERLQAQVAQQAAEVHRLKEHAVILAATAEEVERERCAKLCEDQDTGDASNWSMAVQECARLIRARQDGAGGQA